MENYSRYTRSYWNANPDERKSISEEHLERARQGEETWNTWANRFQEWIQQNEAQEGYIRICNIEIPEEVEFERFLFPCDTNFRGSTFNGDADFRGITFSENANFSKTTFKRYAHFSKATFSGHTNFSETTFNGYVHLGKATFSGIADFRGSTFSDYVDFSESTFSGYANFRGSTFNGVANFRETTFSGVAGFTRVTFEAKSYVLSSENSLQNLFEEAIFLDEQEVNEENLNNHIPFEVSLSASRISAMNMTHLIRGIIATYNNYYYLYTTEEIDHEVIQNQIANTYSQMDANNELYITAIKQGSIKLDGLGLEKIIPALIDSGIRLTTATVDSINKIRDKNMELKEREQALRHTKALNQVQLESEKLKNIDTAITISERIEGNPLIAQVTESVLGDFNVENIIRLLPKPKSETVKKNQEQYIRDSNQHFGNGIAKNVNNDIEISFELQKTEEKE